MAALEPMAEAAGVRMALLTGRERGPSREAMMAALAKGEIDILVGTHALFSEDVAFRDLGLAVVDEQHRFGVHQRMTLQGKGERMVDVLVMTATPIPRTLALTLYGDLDLSVLDELPPGRTPVVTRSLPDERAPEVWDFLGKQIAAGHQAYVVYPVIEENEERELKAAEQMHRQLRDKIFPRLHVGLLHGRLDADEKERVMREFQQGKIEILVATTVIEVGVDVPNATVMVIEHADRFGLAQLHQLRGRIGRGAAKSYCVLMRGGKVSEEGERRLDAMVRSNDGFQIAELDLELRGPGEFFGTKQAGIPSFRVANIIRDRQLLEAAKREAALVISGPNAEISKEEIDRALREMRLRWATSYGLVEVG
jgi:ATP-dependent DNA helicase RecG